MKLLNVLKNTKYPITEAIGGEYPHTQLNYDAGPVCLSD